jgi:ElaB/YqjD/DUF883 family membrane-anchored ribosome-binding protein
MIHRHFHISQVQRERDNERMTETQRHVESCEYWEGFAIAAGLGFVLGFLLAGAV